MTLVYDRVVNGPASHAFVIGCGRFRAYRHDGSVDRIATVAGARAMTKFLIGQADNLVAPLASVECLLSDPTVARGRDALPRGQWEHDPRTSYKVDAAISRTVENAGAAWLDRCRPGDHMIFYLASHGVAERDGTAVGLLEDLKENKFKPWSQSLNVSNLAVALPTTGAGGCWVFLDACQEVVTDLLGQVGGAQGITLLTPKIGDLARARTRSVALAGSRFGNKAWAPANGDPPYFTQALIEGLSGACVDIMEGLGWAVSGRQLLYGLPQVADAALDYPDLETEPLSNFNQHVALLRVAAPMIPVAIRTRVEGHLALAHRVSADDGNGTLIERGAEACLTWRFKIEPSNRNFTAQAEFPAGGPVYQAKTFIAQPPAQIVVLTP